MGDESSATVRVSVVIPTFNRAGTLPRAIDSVLAQTFQDFEILVCDDSSTDSTVEVSRGYQKRDPRVRTLALPVNQGPAAARNLGMREARGDYIAFLDSDDEWLPEKLERQVGRMDAEPPEVGVCFCGDRLIKNEDPDSVSFYLPERGWEQDTFRKYVAGGISFHTPIVLFRRSCLETVGLMSPEMRVNEDAEFLLRFFVHFGLAVIPEPHAVIHLAVSSTAKKVYMCLNAALPCKLRHVDTVRRCFGGWAARCFECGCRLNVLQAAIRERRWRDAGFHLWHRLRAFPCFLPNEVWPIFKALLVSVGVDRLVAALRRRRGAAPGGHRI